MLETIPKLRDECQPFGGRQRTISSGVSNSIFPANEKETRVQTLTTSRSKRSFTFRYYVECILPFWTGVSFTLYALFWAAQARRTMKNLASGQDSWMRQVSG
jgi:hypothetical protein